VSDILQRRGMFLPVIAVVVIAAGAVLLLRPSNPSTSATRTTPAAPVIPATPAKAATPAADGKPSSAKRATLKAGSFSTSYTAGWHLASQRNAARTAAVYKLSSTASEPNNLGIPPAGTIGITIAEYPVSALASTHLVGAPPDPAITKQGTVQMLSHVVGTPGSATGVSRASPPTLSKLAGAEAAIESYGYTYRGVGDVQVSILARHKGHIALIELNTEPALASQGQAELEVIGATWRWH
jgi:hypothetical protein